MAERANLNRTPSPKTLPLPLKDTAGEETILSYCLICLPNLVVSSRTSCTFYFCFIVKLSFALQHGVVDEVCECQANELEVPFTVCVSRTASVSEFSSGCSYFITVDRNIVCKVKTIKPAMHLHSNAVLETPNHEQILYIP